MSQTQSLVKRAMSTYNSSGAGGLVKATSIYLLEQYRNLSVVKTIIRSMRRRRLHKLIKEKPVRLHLGCGSVHLDGYINIDIELWSSACDLAADATDLRMFKDNSVEHIFTHALLEHIPPWDTIKTLKEWHRVLKPAGAIH